MRAAEKEAKVGISSHRCHDSFSLPPRPGHLRGAKKASSRGQPHRVPSSDADQGTRAQGRQVVRLRDTNRPADEAAAAVVCIIYVSGFGPGNSSHYRESDVHKLNDSKEYLAAFASKYKKMELRVDAHQRTQIEMEENAA